MSRLSSKLPPFLRKMKSSGIMQIKGDTSLVVRINEIGQQCHNLGLTFLGGTLFFLGSRLKVEPLAPEASRDRGLSAGEDGAI